MPLASGIFNILRYIQVKTELGSPMEFDPENHETQEIVEAPAKRRLPLNRSIFTAILVSVGLLVWLLTGVVSNNETVEAAIAINVAKPPQTSFKVVVHELDAKPYPNEIVLQARSEADKVVTIAAETGGTISALPVEKGAFVQKDQIICRIDVGARQANLDQARAQRDARKIEYNAARKLNKQGHTSKSQLAASRAAFDGAVANVKAALVELERTKIRAPFDGILDRQPVKIGHYMAPGQPCGTVIDKDPLLVVGYIAETQVNQVSIGARGKAKLSTGDMADGVIRYIAETPNMATRTFRVEMEVPNKDLALRDGMTAEMRIKAGEILATRVPQSTLTLADNGKLSVRVVENGRVALRSVTVLKDEIDGALVAGLAAREKVIVRGGEFTRDGREVEFEIEPIAEAAQN